MNNQIESRIAAIIRDIEKSCIKNKLNLTVYDGKIGFVDQEQRKIIAVWNPMYALTQNPPEKNAGLSDNGI